MYFVLSENIRFADQYPLLSAYNARQFIIHIYTSKINSIKDVIIQIENRHRQRKIVIDQYYKKEANLSKYN